MLLSHDYANCEGALSLLREALACLQVGGVRLDGPSRNHGSCTEDDAREHRYVPHAGQQYLDIDVDELENALKQQIELLQNCHDCMQQWPAQDGEKDYSTQADAPFVPPAPASVPEASTSHGDVHLYTRHSDSSATKFQNLKMPLYFEIIEDIFVEVD